MRVTWVVPLYVPPTTSTGYIRWAYSAFGVIPTLRYWGSSPIGAISHVVYPVRSLNVCCPQWLAQWHFDISYEIPGSLQLSPCAWNMSTMLCWMEFVKNLGLSRLPSQSRCFLNKRRRAGPLAEPWCRWLSGYPLLLENSIYSNSTRMKNQQSISRQTETLNLPSPGKKQSSSNCDDSTANALFQAF